MTGGIDALTRRRLAENKCFWSPKCKLICGLMNVLITNRVLVSGSGTETVARDLALELKRLGHEAAIYSPQLGPVAEQIRAQGVAVFSDIRRVEPVPDIIHGHHHAQTLTALLQFPAARAVFVCHDATAWHDEALLFPRVLRYVAVDHRCLKRFGQNVGVPPQNVHVIFNAVDVSRFRSRKPLPDKPERAAIFSNYATRFTHVDAVTKACKGFGIAVDVIGTGFGTATTRPEEALPNYDLIFAKARCALEAMAVGTAVVLCDFAGLGAMVNHDNFDELRKLNFGTGNLVHPLDPQLIAAEIKKYDPHEAQLVSERVRKEANLSSAAVEWIELYQEVLKDNSGYHSHADELASVAEYLMHWGYDARIACEKAHIKKLTAWPIIGHWIQWAIDHERTRILKIRDVPPQR